MNESVPGAGSVISRFGWKVSLIIIAASCVTLITALSIMLLVNIAEINNRIEQTHSSFSDLLGLSLVSVIWNLDKPAMDNILEAIIQYEEIVHADISIGGQTIAEKQRPEFIDRHYLYFLNSPDFVLRTIEIKYLEEKIGQVRIAFHYRKTLVNQLVPQLIKLVVLALAVIIVASAIIILLARWLVFKPLSQLEETAISLMQGTLDVPKTFSRFVKREDVFGVLGKAFVEMVGRLKNNIETLDAKVQQRTLELEQSRKEAVAASKAKSFFLSNMSHEIRTPLNSILGMTELLLGSPSRDDRKEILQSLDTAGEMLFRLINDILDLSKIESGQFKLERTEFDLIAQIDALRQTLQVQAGEKGLAFVCRIDTDVSPYRIGDPTRLHQILINLLGNAIKFTSEGEVALIVSNSSPSLNDDRLDFLVRDTGIGIGQENQSVIFESFSQANPFTTRKFGGSGLGLAITRSLVEKMEGKIHIRSEEGKGTEFNVEIALPCSPSPAVVQESPPIPRSGTAAPSDEAPSFPRLSLLLAEDIADNRNVVRLFLKGLPVTIDIAVNGQQAVEKAFHNRYDCVLMDIQMPVMDGIEATKAIRKSEIESEKDRVFIIALTAYAFKDEQDKCIEAGCDAVLSKPIKKHLLLDRLVSAVEPPRETAILQEGSVFKESVDREMKVLVPEFIQEIKESIGLIETALKADDFESVARLSTGFKDAAESYNLKKLEKIFSDLLKAVGEQNCETLENLLNTAIKYTQEVEISYV